MDNNKKVYEEPMVEMVEFDFSDRIAASGCGLLAMMSCSNAADFSPW